MTEDELVERIPQLNSAQFFDELESTNDYAKSAIKLAELSFPFIIFTPTQTKGRGRADKSWESSKGSLTFSFGISASDYPIPIHLISILCGLVVAKAINNECSDTICKIKWPNDVYANGKKISGVLIESVESVQADVRGIVIGCGINVNNSFHLDSNSNLAATSIVDETGRRIDIQELMVAIANSLFALCDAFVAGGGETGEIPESILQDFRAIDFLTGKTISIQVGSEISTGKYSGIAANGALKLEMNSSLRAFHSGSIVKIEE